MTPSPDKKLASAGAVWRVYWQYTKRHPYLLAGAILGGVIMQMALLSAPLFLREFFNLVAQGTTNISQLTTLLFIAGGLYFVEWVGQRLRGWSIMIFSAKVMADLMSEAFGYLIGHSYNFFISRFAGSLTHRVNKFARAYETLSDTLILSFGPTLLFITGAVVVLATRHPLLGLMLGAWVIIFLAFQVWVSLLQQPLRAARSEAETRTTGSLADAIGNQVTIQLFSGRAHEQKLFHGVVDLWRKATMRSWFAEEYTWMAIGLFFIAIEIGLLYGATMFWAAGALTIGDFVLIQAYLLTTFDRLVSVNRELRRFYGALADAQEMVAILETPHEVSDKKGAKKLKVTAGEVWFDDVSFRFGDGKQVLEEFNLTIARGEKVALVGPSGAGKSTVTKLLLRLYDVDKGRVLVDGQEVSKVTQESLREAIGFVPQEPILFHRTLMENIRYGRRDATDAEVLAAAKAAHCHEFIDALPQKYDTFVGERGIKLSGGERQRVAIARAILKNAPVLILDEATSSLDSESEAYIQDALETLMQGKTVITVAHRLSTIMKMDRIVVMQHGRLVAQGTHLELIREKGLYQKLWSIQAGGFLGDGEKPKDSVEDITVALADDEDEK